jgi:hypothetical protein
VTSATCWPSEQRREHAQGRDPQAANEAADVYLIRLSYTSRAPGGHAKTSDADRTLGALSRWYDERINPMTASNETPATPDQTEPGFAEGMRRRPWRRQRRGRFSQGLARRVTRFWRLPRFSRGMQRRPEAPGQESGGRFSEGMEQASPKG